jgi:hypothetical protein
MYELSVTVDLLVVITCAGLLMRFGRLGHSHPGSIYLFFHLYTFTSRIIALAFGAPTMFTELGSYLQFRPIEPFEIQRAMILADVALAVVTYACIKASSDDLKDVQRNPPAPESKLPTLSFHHITWVTRLTFPIGLIAILAFTYIPGAENFNVNLGELETSSGVLATRSWAGISLLAMIYWSGFRWYLMMMMSIYLMILGVQGIHRFRVILPILMLMQIYVDRRNLRWPPLKLCAVMLCVGLLFFPLKRIGDSVRRGASFEEIFNKTSQIISDATTGQANDQNFLDQFACSLTLTDERGHFYYGGTYSALLTLPVPRLVWPEKPGLAEHVKDISTPERPMGDMGMILTYLGEAYLNFWYFGIIITPFLLAYLSTRFYFRAYRSHYFSVMRLCYILLAVNLIQVLRDGLLSLFLFIFLGMLPLVSIALLHYFFPVKWRLRSSLQRQKPLPTQAPAQIG